MSKEPYDWCCPDCQEIECECDPPRPISKAHPCYKDLTRELARAISWELAWPRKEKNDGE